MLALGTTPALAQTAQPSATPAPAPADPIVLQSPIAPPATTAPTTPTPAPRVTQPVAQPTAQPTIVLDVPEVDEPVAAPVRTQARTQAPAPVDAAPEEEPVREARSAPAAAAAPAPSASTAAPSSSSDTPVASNDGAALPVASEAAPIALPESAPVDPSLTEQQAVQPDWAAIISLALLGVIPIGLAFLAFAWFRRRSRRLTALEAHVAEPVDPALLEPAPVEPAAVNPEPVIRRDPVVTQPAAPVAHEPVRAHPLDGYRGLPNKGAAVSLPSELPESAEEREALLKRMVAAEPDRANPFRSGKARAKRARLILQSLGRSFENVKPRFDLSQYTQNWPALARGRTAYA